MRILVNAASKPGSTAVSYEAALSGRTVYIGRLLSSGPIGDPASPDEEPVDVGGIVETTWGTGFAAELSPR